MVPSGRRAEDRPDTWERLKNGRPSVHLLRGSELRALRRLQREQTPPSPYVFTTERRTPMTAAGLRKLLTRIGQAAEFPSPVHPHRLRHACGSALALAHDRHDTRAIQEWLGHRNIQPTTRSTELTAHRFRDFWAREDGAPCVLSRRVRAPRGARPRRRKWWAWWQREG